MEIGTKKANSSKEDLGILDSVKVNAYSQDEEEVIAFDELINELGVEIRSFKIKVKKNVKEFLVKLTKQEQELLLHTIYQLPEGDIKKLPDGEGLYSLKMSKFRMIYSVYKDIITVIVLKHEQ